MMDVCGDDRHGIKILAGAQFLVVRVYVRNIEPIRQKPRTVFSAATNRHNVGPWVRPQTR